MDELIKPEPVIQKATVDLLYDGEEQPASVTADALKRPEDVVNDLLSGGNDDDDLDVDAKNIGLGDQKEDVGHFEVKNDQVEVSNNQFEVTNNQFDVDNDQSAVKDAPISAGDDPFKMGSEIADVKEVPFEVRDEPSEVKDIPFEVKAEPSEIKEEPTEVKEDPFEVDTVPRDVQAEIDPLADFSAPSEVKQGCKLSFVVTVECYL